MPRNELPSMSWPAAEQAVTDDCAYQGIRYGLLTLRQSYKLIREKRGSESLCDVCDGSGFTHADGTVAPSILAEMLCGHQLCEACYRAGCARCQAEE